MMAVCNNFFDGMRIANFGNISLHGLEVIENVQLTDGFLEYPSKRNKNKRIQKKWIKKYGYKRKPIPNKNIYIFENKILMAHPAIIKKMMKGMNKVEKSTGINNKNI